MNGINRVTADDWRRALNGLADELDAEKADGDRLALRLSRSAVVLARNPKCRRRIAKLIELSNIKPDGEHHG